MTLEALGYNDDLKAFRTDEKLDSFGVGRVISEHKERYVVKTAEEEFDAEIVGNLRFSANDRTDFPAVGDWVAISEYDENKALIHAVFPRKSVIERQAVSKQSEKQIIATNIDCGLIVQAVDRDFNLNRIERYLTICNASGVKPVVVLSKIDLIDQAELDTMLEQLSQRIKNVDVLTMSNQTNNGFEQLLALIEAGKSYCLLGSSGVGKSTLLNAMSGTAKMKTGKISDSVNKGRHITSHRELIVLENGGILIDNPGMREVGIADTSSGLETTFETIIAFAENCRFNDCTHMHEKGCAIIAAVESGEIDEDAYHNFQKMEKEKDFFESSLQDKKKKDKDLGKLIKNMKKQRKNDKY